MRRVAVAVGLTVVVLLASVGVERAPGALAMPPRAVASLGAAVVEAPTTGADDAPPTAPVDDTADGESGVGGVDPGSDTPSPRGEPVPPRTQRIADTAIFVGLLVVFIGGVAVALWSARRTRSRRPS